MGKTYKVIPRNVEEDGLPVFGTIYSIIADIPELNRKNVKISFLPTAANSTILQQVGFFKQNFGREITALLEPSGENSFMLTDR